MAAPGQVSPLVDNSFSDVYRAPPRPLPYDVDSRYSRVQRDGLISRREKASSHFHDESEPLQRCSSSSGLDSPPDKWKRIEFDEQSKSGLSDSSGKHLLSKVSSEVDYTFPSSEDEDVCPTCLEGEPGSCRHILITSLRCILWFVSVIPLHNSYF